MEAKKRNVLMISYYFPPSGGSGVLRMVRYISNILQYGWKPFVITIDARDLDKIAYGTVNRDESFAGIEKTVEILRVRSRRPSYALTMLGRPIKGAWQAVGSRVLPSRSARPRAQSKTKDHSDGGPTATETVSSATHGQGPRISVLGRISRFFFDFIIIVDQLFEWSVPAICRGVPFVRRNKISCIFSSSPPWSVHIIALFLKRLCRKRWVMDLRDPIYGISGDGRKRSRSFLIESFNKSLEKLLIRNADVVVCNCEEIREYYRQRYEKKRFEVILNSYDQNDFVRGIEKRKGRDRIIIRYVGELYETIRTPDAFLRASAELLREEPMLKEKLSIAFIGERRYFQLPVFQNLLAALELQAIVQTEGYVPHRAAIIAMQESDALLLLQPHESTRYQVPAKLYEYIAAGNPILAIAPTGSATYNIVKRYGLGTVNDPNDMAGIKQSIRDAIAGNVPMPPRAVVEEFSAARMTKKLVDIMESLQ